MMCLKLNAKLFSVLFFYFSRAQMGKLCLIKVKREKCEMGIGTYDWFYCSLYVFVDLAFSLLAEGILMIKELRWGGVYKK